MALKPIVLVLLLALANLSFGFNYGRSFGSGGSTFGSGGSNFGSSNWGRGYGSSNRFSSSFGRNNFWSGSGSSGGGGGWTRVNRPPHDIRTKSGLTRAFNDPVVSAQVVSRPLNMRGGGLADSLFGARHKGMLLTTRSGKSRLVHSGGNHGIDSDAVMVDGRHMSGRWSREGRQMDIGGRLNVGDFVKAASKNPRYSLFGNNCLDATDRMCRLGRRGNN